MLNKLILRRCKIIDDKEEVNYYQPRFKRWIKSDKWDCVAEILNDDIINIITQIMNAKKTVITVGEFGTMLILR